MSFGQMSGCRARAADVCVCVEVERCRPSRGSGAFEGRGVTTASLSVREEIAKRSRAAVGGDQQQTAELEMVMSLGRSSMRLREW